MGQFIAIHLLKHYNPGTFNRGENGEAKQIIVGGVNRARFSSQCQKRAIREMMACEEIRSAHIEKLISMCLDVRVNDGTISEDEKNLIGSLICSKKVIGTDCWAKLSKTNAEESKKDLQGNVVVNTNAAEIDALINSFIDYLKANGEADLKKNCEKIAKTAALTDVKISIAKALFGSMATDGVLGTVDGALQMGQAFSVDAFMPESDFFTVKFTGRSGADENDPFYSVYKQFNDVESNKANGETINNGLSLNSNLMYSYANINVKELERNLNTFICPRQYTENPDMINTIIDTITDFIQNMILMTPEATQNRSSSHVEPTAVLIEVIDHGTNLQPDWSNVIIPNDTSSTTDQAISILSNFANDDTFRLGTIKQYVMFGSNFKKNSDKFTKATTINNLLSLKNTLTSDIKSMLTNE